MSLVDSSIGTVMVWNVHKNKMKGHEDSPEGNEFSQEQEPTGEVSPFYR